MQPWDGTSPEHVHLFPAQGALSSRSEPLPCLSPSTHTSSQNRPPHSFTFLAPSSFTMAIHLLLVLNAGCDKNIILFHYLYTSIKLLNRSIRHRGNAVSKHVFLYKHAKGLYAFEK